MRKILVRLLSPFLQLGVKYYFSKPRNYSYKKIKAIVLPTVFFPHLTISTKLLLQFLESRSLENKSFLELGCGTGIISVFAAQKYAKVSASDINPKAIENAQLNASKNGVEIKIIHSDLFDKISIQIFDTIIINPPYYPKNPENKAEEAWYCGEQFQYFEKLFSTVSPYFNTTSDVFMILSEDCEIKKIKSIGSKYNLHFTTVLERKKWGETNYIFKIN